MKTRIILYPGDKFNKLTFLEDAGTGGKLGHHKRLGKFKCDCGSTTIKVISSVKNNSVRTCGCGKTIKLKVGDKFNKLTFIKNVETPTTSKVGNFQYGLFKCDCGGEAITRVIGVKNGHTLSCGCVQRALVRLMQRARTLPYGEASRRALYNKYLHGARKRDFSFSITEEHFNKLTKQNCHYCGVIAKQEYRNRNSNGSYVYNGIDRIDNKLGYEKNNVVTCCWLCNKLKGTFDKSVFMKQIRQIHNHASKGA